MPTHSVKKIVLSCFNLTSALLCQNSAMAEQTEPAPLDLEPPTRKDPMAQARFQEVPAPAAPATPFNERAASRYSLMVPAGAYHFNSSGQHVQGLNETRNYGLGFTVRVGEDTEAFAVAYRSSFANKPQYKNEVAVAAGVNWDPLKVDLGPLHLKAGLMAGVAYTSKGSYADTAPQVSRGRLTLLGGLHSEAIHKPSGMGLGVTVIPPRDKSSFGTAAAYLKKEF